MGRQSRIKAIAGSFVFSVLLISIVLYAITFATIGLSARGGLYSETVSRYFDYPAALRTGIISISCYFLRLFNYNVSLANSEFLFNSHHGGLHMAYGCMGFGLMALWIGFIASCRPFTVLTRILLIIMGLAIINILNVLRVCFLYASHTNRVIGMEHHNLYNIVLHLAVLIMGIIVIKSSKQNVFGG